MATKLIIIEGLPGSGKTTTAEITNEVLNEMALEHQTFYEGNLDHPADYDGVSCLDPLEFTELLTMYEKHSSFLGRNAIREGNNFFIPYAKLKKELGNRFPNELLNALCDYDIYELPLDKHIDLILDRWRDFVEKALKDDCVYIFECCFIQNPVTVSMIRDNSPKEVTIDYIKKLAKIIEPLDPVLIYVDQENIEESFRKVAEDRSDSWLNGFIDYYTNQEFGNVNNMHGIEGTIEVLKHRKKLELEIIDRLDMKKLMLDNSSYDRTRIKNTIREELTKYSDI